MISPSPARRPRRKSTRQRRVSLWSGALLITLLVTQVVVVGWAHVTLGEAPFADSWLGQAISSVTYLRPIPYSQIRGITFYDINGDTSEPQFLRELQSDLPTIKSVGFNTVRLVSTWRRFEPETLPSPQYNEQAFQNLRSILRLLRGYGMRALLGLNYLGDGWAPGGISYCSWIIDPRQYQAFERYVQTYLTNILDYADMTYVMVFAENSTPCNLTESANGPQVAAALRPTLGSLPSHLPSALRSRFQIGFQDSSLISMQWANGASEVQSPISFDFLSMGFYDPQQKDLDRVHDKYSDGCALSVLDACAAQKLEKRTARFHKLYPNTPVILGEIGASYCGVGQSVQANVVTAIARAAQQHSLGFAVWQWKPGPPHLDCDPHLGFGGTAITNPDGTLNAAGTALRALWVRAIRGP